MTTSPVKIWRNQKHVRSLLGAKGVIVSFTIVRVPPAGYESQAPYPVVLVDTGNGRFAGQLVDYTSEHLKVGQNVMSVLRRVTTPGTEGVIPYGVKFKPI